jgi:Heterokaryon incompatibility protein (HET)
MDDDHGRSPDAHSTNPYQYREDPGRRSVSPSSFFRANRRRFRVQNRSPSPPASTSKALSALAKTPVLKQAALRYEPLDTSKREIRLLELSAQGQGEPNLVRRLFTVSLDQAPSYECLSYTWEIKPSDGFLSRAPLPPRAISINGCAVNVKHNLYRALVQLVRPGTTRLLWVDALCIDQRNQVEVGDQVAKMGVIYAAATNVIVWVGEAIQHVCPAFPLLEELSSNISDNEAVRNILRSPKSLPGLDSMTEIFRRDYWSRVWVIQEVHFAKSIVVHCGEYSMSWIKMVQVQNALIDRFLDILDELTQPRYSFENVKHMEYLRHAVQFRGPRSLVLDRENLSRGSTEIDLFEGLLMHRLKKATDPRDKIYAIVGLTKAANDAEFMIDYLLSTRQVFINTVDYILRKTENLDILLAHTKGIIDLDLPTWVPNFGSSGILCPVPFRHAILKSAYRASETRKAVARIDCMNDVLFAQGICIASIKAVAPLNETSYVNEELVGTSTVEAWRDYVLDHAADNYLGRVEELERLLLCDIPERTGPKTEFEMSPFDQNGSLNREYWAAVPNVQAITHNMFKRNIFITDDGNLGMAQDSILEGDLVCVLFGCSIPVILRIVDAHFIFVSDACVVGYMYGKGIEELEAGSFEAETFEIH